MTVRLSFAANCVSKYAAAAPPVAPIPAVGPPGAPLIQPATPITLGGSAPGVPFIDSTADVDVNGQTANGSLLGKSASDSSVVKLRSKEVKEA